ncbi:MAG: DUF4249 domain-containing protein [Saprospiraceae bacterium]|nr:DUF4249 domain-containing protein [Saprospiraceae bacterium]
MKLKYHLMVLMLLSMCGCIEQIEFPIEESKSLVVVDGTFSDLDEIQEIKLSFTVDVNLQIFKPVSGADVRVEEEGGELIQFTEAQGGVYKTQSRAEVGKKYRLNAILPDGAKLTSRFQGVKPSFPVNSVSIVDTVANFINESGKRITLRSIECFAQSEAPAPSESLFLRYDLETVWFLSEIVCSPFVPPKSCYVYDKDIAFDLNLIEVSPEQGNLDFETFIFRRNIDEAFGEVFSLKVDLLSYNEEEFRYWETLQSLFEQSGNITDILPARLPSLIETDGDEEVFGYFAVVGKSSYVQLIRNADFATFVNPYCGAAGFPPFPFNRTCCNCLMEPGASIEKPDYWP